MCDFNWSIHLNGAKAKPTLCGTTEYMPPEVVKNQPHDTGVDIWSLGILLYVLNIKYNISICYMENCYLNVKIEVNCQN